MKCLVVGLLAAALAMGGGVAEGSAQDLSISVAGGAAQVHAGDRLHYAVTIRDAAGRAHDGVRVELTLPVGARATKVDGGKAPEPWFAAWTTAVPSSGGTTVTADFVAGRPASGAKGYPVSACVVSGGVRLTCASRVEQLADTPSVHALAPPPSRAWLWWLLLAVPVAGLLSWRFNRRRSRS